MTVRSRVSITARTINATWLQAREGAHLILHCKSVDLSDAEFLRPSIVAGPRTVGQIPVRSRRGDARRFSCGHSEKRCSDGCEKLCDDLTDKSTRWLPRCDVTSLARATTGELVLSNAVLDNCTFAGAHGLDKLRIGTDCSFQSTPKWWRWQSFTSRRMFSARRLIAEEIRWRRAHSGPKKHRDPAGAALSAPEIAGIYRDLRKGLEDVKNEPGAADFYYGEMEMRRLAGRNPIRRRRPLRGEEPRAIGNGTCSAIRVLGGIRVRPAGIACR